MALLAGDLGLEMLAVIKGGKVGEALKTRAPRDGNPSRPTLPQRAKSGRLLFKLLKVTADTDLGGGHPCAGALLDAQMTETAVGFKLADMLGVAEEEGLGRQRLGSPKPDQSQEQHPREEQRGVPKAPLMGFSWLVWQGWDLLNLEAMRSRG